jgi:monoterpene epsilon-lactone hydrolase
LVSKELEKVISLLKQFQSPGKPSVAHSRESVEQMANMISVPKDVECERATTCRVPAEWVIAPNASHNHVILYLHGGGYISGSIKTHRELASRISRAAKSRVLIIDYRLAPEAPFPAALEDAEKAYQWLTSEKGIKPSDLAIVGDSAGGGLTVATLVKLRDEGIALPTSAVCLSPWTDLANTGMSFKRNVKIDPFLIPEELVFMADKYLNGEDAHNPLASPLYADLHGLPPILIQVGTSEVLLDDSVRLADRAKAHGVEVKLDIWKDMIHVFQAFAAFVPESRQAIDQIGMFIRKFLR